MGYEKSCRIPNPILTLYTGFVPLSNHLGKYLSRMKMLQLGRNWIYLLIQLLYFTNDKPGLEIGLVSFKAII